MTILCYDPPGGPVDTAPPTGPARPGVVNSHSAILPARKQPSTATPLSPPTLLCPLRFLGHESATNYRWCTLAVLKYHSVSDSVFEGAELARGQRRQFGQRLAVGQLELRRRSARRLGSLSDVGRGRQAWRGHRSAGMTQWCLWSTALSQSRAVGRQAGGTFFECSLKGRVVVDTVEGCGRQSQPGCTTTSAIPPRPCPPGRP